MERIQPVNAMLALSDHGCSMAFQSKPGDQLAATELRPAGGGLVEGSSQFLGLGHLMTRSCGRHDRSVPPRAFGGTPDVESLTSTWDRHWTAEITAATPAAQATPRRLTGRHRRREAEIHTLVTAVGSILDVLAHADAATRPRSTSASGCASPTSRASTIKAPSD